jgi:NAD-dependent SIR2 family protein deacetylase
VTSKAPPQFEGLTKEELHAVKVRVQEFFAPNTVIIIGLGPSAALGLPTMCHLADWLNAKLSDLNGEDREVWNAVQANLTAGHGLEKSLQTVSLSHDLYKRIVSETAKAIHEKEADAIQSILIRASPTPFGKLLAHLVAGTKSIDVVTCNYDRLLEVQAELAGIPVDTGYFGAYAGKFSPQASSRAYAKLTWDGRKYSRAIEGHVRIHKPHGSLDWTHCPNGVRNCLLSTDAPAIIPPGPTKYRDGYQEVFALQLERARTALRNAQRYIVVGYGFNDDQLEQSWCPNLTCEKPVLLITKELTANAHTALDRSPQAVAFTANSENAAASVFHVPGASPKIVSEDLWSLDGLVGGTI